MKSKVHEETKEIFTKALPYLEKGYKPSEVDKILGIPKRKTSKAMKAMGCKWSDYHGGSTYKNKEWLTEKYLELNSAEKIGKIAGVPAKTITWWRKKLGIPKADPSQAARKYTITKDYFRKIDSATKAYWLGFLMADGCVYTKYNKKSYTKVLILGLASKDEDHIKKMLTAMKANYPIRHGESKAPNGKYYNNASVFITCTEMCEDLEKHGVNGKKTFEASIPPDLNKSYIRHFIRGFFDGDGTLLRCNRSDHNRAFSLCSASKHILQDIKMHFESVLSIPEYSIKKIDRDIYKHDFYLYTVSGISNNYKIFKYLYNYSPTALDRKKKTARYFIKNALRAS